MGRRRAAAMESVNLSTTDTVSSHLSVDIILEIKIVNMWLGPNQRL